MKRLVYLFLIQNTLLNGQIIVNLDSLSFKHWLKTEESFNRLRKNLTDSSINLSNSNDTFYVANGFYYQNIFNLISKSLIERNSETKFIMESLLLSSRNGLIPNLNIYSKLPQRFVDSLNLAYLDYNNKIDSLTQHEISIMVQKDQAVRNEHVFDKINMEKVDIENIKKLKDIIHSLKKWPGTNIIGLKYNPYIIAMHTTSNEDLLYFLDEVVKSCKNGHEAWYNAVSLLSHKILRLRKPDNQYTELMYVGKCDSDMEYFEVYSFFYLLQKIPFLQIDFCLSDQKTIDSIRLIGEEFENELKRVNFIEKCDVNSYKLKFSK